MSDGGSDTGFHAGAVNIKFNPKTVARLFAENFERPETRISAAAINASAEYLRIFTREAIWRTANEIDASGQKKRTMEASDLEKVAGTLVLDF
ncbi:CENP-S associating centromere protein X-domain-containing protein [Lipomyces japonicus]|uniref:CENP-S associating centromere protein X-domain-containing protein n=1 Tax=Lipomyces japonicus TaxID=56871 RepID=UPI0034CFCBA4